MSETVKPCSVCWSQIYNALSNLCPRSKIQSAADTLVLRGWGWGVWHHKSSQWPSSFLSVPFTSRFLQQRGARNQSDGQSAVDKEIASAAFSKNEMFFSWAMEEKLDIEKITPEHLCIVKRRPPPHTLQATWSLQTHFLQTFKLYYLWPWGSLNSL